ncbi:N-acetylmuramic acid 6-phosphate etherase [Waterburya agarophytonicola K14]|uniref:N-acetylmuramic acid 6-phosphate etherase n=1 Tax=Waterburya agarophytonicola KI4 TaxID=2874699 RepID=A0A964FG75_9CYAN|nr:N-acetylmuramic acid 6-phosphate etherase [Waterburya agarophytonicola]MCC0177882.1 N-acetylmuramic acid 6-phosphate etherase [Waterburya agarophytonicola KI4]
MDNLQSRGHLLTEQINPNSQNLDSLSSLEIVDLFNQEDNKTIEAIAKARIPLAQTIDATTLAFKQGGRLFYVGAGTSGRLGVLDAAECPPTFCTSPELVQGILAGGKDALVKSSEALEDRPADGAKAIAEREISKLDVVVGITAGGTTPYVRGALQEAKAREATTVAISCVSAEQVPMEADIDIRLLVGAEILAGSTRLKAGTVTKMALNIISTGAMVGYGKVYGNRMIDVAVTNDKLQDRALRIISDLTDLNRQEASLLLDKSQNKVKLALLMHWTGLDIAAGEELLDKNKGNLRLSITNNQ